MNEQLREVMAERVPLALIANDQEWTARSIESILTPLGYDVVRAYTGGQAIERAQAARPDLIVLDAQLPDIHGFEVCRTLRADSRIGAMVPIIVTTSGPAGRVQRLAAYEAGAWEFLGQPLDAEALVLRVRNFVRARLESEALRDHGLLDAASGLYNMRGLTRRTREILAHAARRRESIACVVVVADVRSEGGEPVEPDRLRAAGDQIGEALRTAGRACDAIGRISTHEFAVVAPATSAEGIEPLVARLDERLRSALERRRITESVQVRAGYCAITDAATSSLEPSEMLLRATSAAREAARLGNGTVLMEFSAPVE